MTSQALSSSAKGRHDLLILPDAAKFHESIDVRRGEDVLLHIRPAPARGVLAVNTLRGGRWGREQHIAFPAEQTVPLPLTIETLASNKVRVTLADEPPLEMALHAPLSAGRFCLSRNIRVQPSAEATGLLHAQISRADMEHVSGLLQIRATPDRAPVELVVHGDGRLLGEMRIIPVEGEGVVVQTFSLIHPPHALIYEDILIELFRRDPEGLVLLDAMPLQPIYVGAVEYASERELTGWARNPNLPSRHVMLDIYMNGRHQGATRADLPHSGPGLAEGRCGFEYRLPEPVYMPEARQVDLSVRIRDTSIELLHSPWAIGRPLALQPLTAGPEPDAEI
ncbi:hypothetical protein ACVFYP_21950 [Roseomonas sp. F4]